MKKLNSNLTSGQNVNCSMDISTQKEYIQKLQNNSLNAREEKALYDAIMAQFKPVYLSSSVYDMDELKSYWVWGIWQALQKADTSYKGDIIQHIVKKVGWYETKHYMHKKRNETLKLFCAYCASYYRSPLSRSRYKCRCGHTLGYDYDGDNLNLSHYMKKRGEFDYIRTQALYRENEKIKESFSSIISQILSFSVIFLDEEEKSYCVEAIKQRKDIYSYIRATGATKQKARRIKRKLQHLMKPYASELLAM